MQRQAVDLAGVVGRLEPFGVSGLPKGSGVSSSPADLSCAPDGSLVPHQGEAPFRLIGGQVGQRGPERVDQPLTHDAEGLLPGWPKVPSAKSSVKNAK